MADPQDRPVGTGHDPDTPSLRTLALAAGGVVAMIALALAAALGIVKTGPSVSSIPRAPGDGAAPRLQAVPEADIVAYRREKEALLHGYAWVDRSHGIVRIPIERAMALLASPQPPGARRP